MSTLVEELRDRPNFVAQGPAYLIKKCEQAADEITRLKGERDLYRRQADDLHLKISTALADFATATNALSDMTALQIETQARAEAAEAEVERLKSDVDDLVRAGSDEATENARLREALTKIAAVRPEIVTHVPEGFAPILSCQQIASDALQIQDPTP